MTNSTVTPAAFTPPSFVLVTPDEAFADIHDQLLTRNDQVHPIVDHDDLIRNRLGEPGFTKQCFALIQESIDGTRDVLAAIYVHMSTTDPNARSEELLIGRVDQLLSMKAAVAEMERNLFTCYSISSYGKIAPAEPGQQPRRAGKALIENLWSTFCNSAQSPIVSTLSPFRTFANFIERTGRPMPQTDQDFRLAAAAHLKERVNPVQKFHQENGAYAAAFHVAANKPGTLDEKLGLNMMIGYRYPRSLEALRANQRDWADGKIPASAGIKALMDACP